MDNQSIVSQLIAGVEFRDPKLKDALRYLINDLYTLNNQVNPPTTQSRTLAVVAAAGVTAPTNFTAIIFQNNIRLTWTAPGFDTFLYEIRMGSVYETAEILLTTATLSADIDPVSRVLVAGNIYTFWITTVDNLGNHSSPAQVDVPLFSIGAPALTATTLDNNVLLSWSVPLSVFFIANYIVYRDGVEVGNITGTFNVIFEPTAGTYTYMVQPVDIVGTPGPVSNDVTLTLPNPSNFLQLGELTSTFNGTKVNTHLVELGLFANVDTTEIYEDHFTTRTWASPEDQINAGYPKYFQPAPTSGTYEEVFDFGTIFDAVIVTVTFGISFVSGVISIQTEIAVSDDDITYDSFIVGTSRFAETARYVKVKFTFTGSDTSATIMSNLRVLLNVRTETEDGTVAALAADAGGTHVTLTKPFESIKAVSLQPQSTTSCFAVYDDLDEDGFDVYVFDAAGIRVDKTVSWFVRGLV